MKNDLNSVSTENLITLIYILDDYKNLQSDLNEFMNNCKYMSDIYYIDRLCNGKIVFGQKKLKQFYIDNKETLDKINKSTLIYSFLSEVNNESLNNYYDYFMRNRDKLDDIIKMIKKIKSLNIDRIKFDESIDFTSNEYSINSTFFYQQTFSYLDNMKGMASYSSNKQKYFTTDSNYELILEISFDQISKYGNEIVLNSFFFDPNRLPDVLTKETTFDKIIAMKDDKKINEENNIIRSSVNLSLDIENLDSEYKNICKTIESINDINTKGELRNSLLFLKTELDKIKTISNNYNQKIINDSDLTEQVLDSEKAKEKSRRFWSRIDLD